MKSFKKVILSGLVLSTMALSNQAAAGAKIGEWYQTVDDAPAVKVKTGSDLLNIKSETVIVDTKRKSINFNVYAKKITGAKQYEGLFNVSQRVIYINDTPIKTVFRCVTRIEGEDVCAESTISEAAYSYIIGELKKGAIKLRATKMFASDSVGNKGMLKQLKESEKRAEIEKKAL